MKKYLYKTPVGQQEVTEEQFRMAYRASPTYALRVKNGDGDAEEPINWSNGYLNGIIEETPDK